MPLGGASGRGPFLKARSKSSLLSRTLNNSWCHLPPAFSQNTSQADRHSGERTSPQQIKPGPESRWLRRKPIPDVSASPSRTIILSLAVFAIRRGRARVRRRGRLKRLVCATVEDTFPQPRYLEEIGRMPRLKIIFSTQGGIFHASHNSTQMEFHRSSTLCSGDCDLHYRRRVLSLARKAWQLMTSSNPKMSSCWLGRTVVISRKRL